MQINPYGSEGFITDESIAPYIDHMHIDGYWMFGSTRAAEPTVAGASIYVWLLDFDGDGNPRSDNLSIRKLDAGAFPGSSHITGVRPTKGESKMIHMIYF